MMKKILRATIYLLGIGTGMGLVLVGVASYINSPPSIEERGDSTDEIFAVSRGESLNSIAERLERRSMIRSREFLVWYSKLKGTETQYQAGHYQIPRGATTFQIHDLLVRGTQILYRVTIPEGWTISKIAIQLEQKGIVSSADFLERVKDEGILRKYGIPGVTAEGYLFPDTYHFPKGYPALRVVEVMIDTFFKRIATLLEGQSIPGGQELFDKVILASIVEREYRDPEEAPLIASVFYNRLRIRMPLSSCATVEYVLTELLGKPHPEFLTYNDLEVPSPYNTYKRAGLPPGPICNPGLVSLRAAFFPAQTPYQYFVLKDPERGRHYFSKTLEEHMRAKVVYLKKVQPGS